ncbi:MAG: hypothetical protein ACR2LK_00775 [Solirubrobacteraceae bacterium]
MDPLGGQQSTPDRARALRWLRPFQAATERRRPWGSEDDETILASMRRAWRESSLGGESALCEHIAALHGARVPLVPEHRDFWAGNIAMNAG